MSEFDDAPSTEPVPETAAFEDLLAFINEARGFDFRGYKRPSLTRRIRKRMAAIGIGDYTGYRERLAADPGEFTALFNTILINVTALRRDREAWDYLAASVLPRLAAAKESDEPLRVWSAGCASGEEVYSLAVLLCDVLGEQRFRETVKIYGTDADEEALIQARQGRYPHKALQEAFSEEQLARYFENPTTAPMLRGDLRRVLIFGRHDLVRDPPISRVDLLVCRNTLMYFNAEAQQRVLANFHFALNPGGFLFLGKSEALATRTSLFSVEDLASRVILKGARSARRANALNTSVEAPASTVLPAAMADAAFDAHPFAEVMLDRELRVLRVNRRARHFFGIGQNQVGRALQDLDALARPGELRGAIDESLRDRRSVTASELHLTLATGGVETFAVHVVPVLVNGAIDAVGLTFEEVSRYVKLREELERSQRELEAAYEALQSTVEELETTNEELHSTNEELETMNEELQSTNEELETINDELRVRSGELDELSSFLQAILSSLRAGVVVLNPAFGVRVWSRQSENLWGLRAEEVVGTHFLNLDIGLPVQELRELIRDCLNGQSEGGMVRISAVNRRGRGFVCQVSVFPLRRENAVIDGVILLMDDANGSAEGTSG